jgi:hypothetical protein
MLPSLYVLPSHCALPFPLCKGMPPDQVSENAVPTYQIAEERKGRVLNCGISGNPGNVKCCGLRPWRLVLERKVSVDGAGEACLPIREARPQP